MPAPTRSVAPAITALHPMSTVHSAPATNTSYWHVGLHSDPLIDVIGGENFGIHPSGFGEMTKNAEPDVQRTGIQRHHHRGLRYR